MSYEYSNEHDQKERVQENIFDFDFIKDKQNRLFLISAANAVSSCNLWHWLNEFDSSTNFMFSTGTEIDMLRTALSKDPINANHSGLSFGFVLRQIEYIAKYGYNMYKIEYLKNN